MDNFNQNNYNPNGYAQGNNFNQNQNNFNPNGYTQNNVNINKANNVFNNTLNKNGKVGLNLMVYVLLASLAFAGEFSTSLVIIFAAAFIVEKDKDLNKVLASMISTLFMLSIIYSIVYMLIDPLSNAGYKIMGAADYDSFFYNLGSWLTDAIISIKQFVSWVYDAALIVIALLNFNKVSKGKFKVPKFISKYFE